jgi:Family of unknown function (DUF6058)
MEQSMIKFTDAEQDYIRSNYFTLDELCAGRPETPETIRRFIRAGELPAATYRLDDGTEWFPADYLDLIDECGGVETLREQFRARIRAAGGSEEDAEQAWADYLGGGFAWCLRQVTPEQMMRKQRLADSVQRLVSDPRPDDPPWCAALRRDVWQLDVVLREFTPDHDRLPSTGVLSEAGVLPSRDRLVTAPQQEYPSAFGANSPRRFLTSADLDYIRAEFVPLLELCASTGHDIQQVRTAIAERRRPGPPYPDVEYVPANYFELPDADEFRRTFAGDSPEKVLESYLDGTYFVCVRNATVANIARKNQLVDEIEMLRSAPRPDDGAWRDRLHALVDELDAIERPFSPDFDRTRFGRPLTRDDLITGTRCRFPRGAAA